VVRCAASGGRREGGSGNGVALPDRQGGEADVIMLAWFPAWRGVGEVDAEGGGGGGAEGG
jgi:hypothetical protein